MFLSITIYISMIRFMMHAKVEFFCPPKSVKISLFLGTFQYLLPCKTNMTWTPIISRCRKKSPFPKDDIFFGFIFVFKECIYFYFRSVPLNLLPLWNNTVDGTNHTILRFVVYPIICRTVLSINRWCFGISSINSRDCQLSSLNQQSIKASCLY